MIDRHGSTTTGRWFGFVALIVTLCLLPYGFVPTILEFIFSLTQYIIKSVLLFAGIVLAFCFIKN